MFAVVVALVTKVQGYSFVKKIGQAILGSAAAVAVMTFFTSEAFDQGIVWLNESVGGAMLGNSTIAGAYFVFALFFGLILFFQESSRIKRYLYGAGLAVIVFSPIFFNIKGFFVTGISLSELVSNPFIIIGQARAAVISVVIGVIITLLSYGAFAHKMKWVKGLFIGGIVTVIAILGYGSSQLFVSSSPIQNAFIEMVGPNRLIFWEEAAQGIKERPVVGWGPENFRVVHQKYFNPQLADPAHGAEIWVDKPHNIFVEILVGQGWVGIVTYGLLFCALFWMVIDIVRKKVVSPQVGSLLIGLLTAYLIQNQFAFDSVVPIIAFWGTMGVIIGLYGSHEKQNNTSLNANNLHIKGIAWGVTVILVIVWVLFAYLPSRKMVVAKKVFDAASDVRVTMYEDLFSGYGSTQLKTGMGMIYYVLASQYLEQRDLIVQNPQVVPMARAEIQALLKAGKEGLTIGKQDYRLVLALAIFQETDIFFKGSFSQEEIDAVFNYLESAIELSPNNPFTYLLHSKALLYLEKIPESRAMIDKAIILNPMVKESHDQKNAFEKAFGTSAQQKAALENAQKNIPGYEFK
jgi:O-antigen ligase